MWEGEIDAEILAIERELDKLLASINKSKLKPVARDSGIPESRRTTMDEAEHHMGHGTRLKSFRKTALSNVHAEPDDLIESSRTNFRELNRFALTSTPYHANTSGHKEGSAATTGMTPNIIMFGTGSGFSFGSSV